MGHRDHDAGRRKPALAALAAVGAALALLAGCAPAYPEEDEVRARFQVQYRDANCTLAKVHPPQPQPQSAGSRYRYIHIRFEARCTHRTGSEETIVRQQVWQRSIERPALLQGAWRWEPAGEISTY